MVLLDQTERLFWPVTTTCCTLGGNYYQIFWGDYPFATYHSCLFSSSTNIIPNTTLITPTIAINCAYSSLFLSSLVTVCFTAKATKAAAALKKGSGRKATRVHTKVHFFRPRTLKLSRNPKVIAKAHKSIEADKSYDVIKFPLTTESAMKKIEENNTLVFIVNLSANKKQIKDAVAKQYQIKAAKVNTLIRYVRLIDVFIFALIYLITSVRSFRPDGQKKAYVRLTSDFEAAEVANKLGLI